MRWTVLGFLFFAMVINFADKSFIGYAAESIMNEFHLTYTQWGLVGSSFFWLFSVSGVFGAAWSDRIGTKKVISFMLIAWTILQFGAFAIIGLPMLMLYRVLLGVSEGPFAPTAISHVSKWFKPESRGMAISVLNSGGMIGTLATAPILVFLIQKFGWRIGFATLGAASLLFLITWLFLSHKNKIEVEKPASQKFKWSEFLVVLRSPTCIICLFAAFSGSWLTMWISLWMPTYLTKVIHLAPMQMGYTSLIIGITSVIVSVIISSFSDQLFRRNQDFQTSRVYVAGISLILGGLFLVSTVLFHSPVWVTIAISLAKGCAYTILAISPQVLMRLLPGRAGLMTSLSTSFMNIAGMVGPIITGVLVQFAGKNVSLGFTYSILLTAGLLLIFGICFSIFAKPEKEMNKYQQKKVSVV